MNIHEETLKIARGLMKKDPSLTDWVISKFPELKESEDEKISKELIAFVKSRLAGFPDCDRFIAWLEKKQGKVPVTIDIDKMVEDYANNNERGNEEFGKPVNCMIRAYRLGITDTLSILNHKQKPAECDEEDENNILFLTSIIKECFKGKEKITLYGDTVCAHFTKEDIIERLKSLRPQRQWKPSDEQMKALHDINLTGNTSYAGQGQLLIELYNDLYTIWKEKEVFK